MTRIIAERFGWKPFYESVINNPYLEDFYSDMGRWSFNLQIYFLSHRFKTHKLMAEGGFSSVQDRTIYEDVEIFARNLYEMGHMDKRDWENYRELFGIMVPYLRKPDLIIYLRADVDTLVERIRNRGRSFEKSIDVSYLTRLNELYESWIERARKEFNVLVVETDNFNVFEDSQKLDRVFARIKDFLGVEGH
ncbi:MAG: deoxynucleoside kinase [Candidatus Neomarinimicrobiota bacterium]|nr:deoxynucleoside kinase [Candidatus Neomarinimicrobiota bacterium]RKY48300.1 MAG: deoxynucleoside kinase [Candidatus Neomarinimicrobiota bacterium]RKY54619.1 MAG: deoxynucleoside kinase [Candidatus Neomarinimicrobiota bacterium]